MSVELALTAPALVEDGDPARLIGLILTQGSVAVGFRVAVVGLVIMTRRRPTPVGSARPGPAPSYGDLLDDDTRAGLNRVQGFQSLART